MIVAILWYVVAVHALASVFFIGRFWERWQARKEGYGITGLLAYLSLGPAIGAMRELQIFRVNVGVALTWTSALLGTLLLVAIYDAHLRKR